MSQVTGGKITYGRTVKTGDYENKRTDVELSFTVDDGQDHAPVAEKVANEVYRLALHILNLKGAATSHAAPSPEPVAAVSSPPPEKPAAPAPAPKATRTKADLEAEAKAKVQPPKMPAVNATGRNEEREADPAAVDDSLFTGQPEEIKDTDLTSAVTKKNAAIKNPMAIRTLISKYVQQPPHQLIKIPQDSRGAFLKELEALKPAA